MTQVIPISSIHVPEDRQRRSFPSQEMDELKASILTEKGLMCPILVRPKGEGSYTLVAGERRLRAVSEILIPYNHGNTEIPPGHIPAVVKDFSDDMEATEAELHENVVRLNLTWQEQVDAIARLHELKKLRNPNHKIGDTAYLIDSGDNEAYASPHSYKKVKASVLVNQFMHIPEVAKAGSLQDAMKVATREIERELLLKLRNKKEEIELEKTRLKEEMKADANGSDTDVANLDGLMPDGAAEDVDPFLAGVFSSRNDSYVIEGDMRDALKQIPDGSINVVITDPPYGVDAEQFQGGGGTALRHDYEDTNTSGLYKALVNGLDRVCAATAHAYIFYDPYVEVEINDITQEDYTRVVSMHQYLTSLFSPEWRVRRTPLIWSKGNTGTLVDGGVQGYRRSYEHILFATRGSRPCSAVISDVLVFPIVKDKVHAAQKPVELYDKLLSMSAIPGDCVLDCFAGSGTIFHAARRYFVKAIGIEKKPVYVEMCKLALEGKMPGKAEV